MVIFCVAKCIYRVCFSKVNVSVKVMYLLGFFGMLNVSIRSIFCVLNVSNGSFLLW